MEVTCTHCGRAFAVDPAKSAGHLGASCVCGERVSLRQRMRLGKYLLVNKIAVGGMGEIYYSKLSGAEGFTREVAIKRMLPHLAADRAFIDLMVKEAKLTVQLNHPNIVQVFDFAKDGDEYYIAMEYVDGINVGTLLESCRRNGVMLPVEVAVHLSLQVLRGLAYAHALKAADGTPMQLLHRDITPQNILVSRDGWVKITDFGIAKARTEISTTSPGMLKGKLGYIAPEQINGQAPDQRADIFCAGVCLWEELAARRLFKGSSDIDAFRLTSEGRVPALTQLRDDVPLELERVVRTALATNREERYASCEAFYDALTEAMFPKTPDDCAVAAKRFMASHPAFFESIADNRADEPSNPTQDLDHAAPLPTIETLLAAPAPGLEPTATKSRGRWVAAALGLVALVVAGVFVARTWRAAPAGEAVRALAPVLYAPNEIQLAVDGEAARLRDCYRLAGRERQRFNALQVELVIPSTGAVAEVRAGPDDLGAVGACLEGVLRRLRLRPHGQDPIVAKVNIPSPPDVPPRSDVEADASKPLKPLEGAEIQAVVRRATPVITRCLRLAGPRAPERVDAEVGIEPSGKVSSVELTPALTGDAAGECLVRALRGLRFRRHPDKIFKVTIPFMLTRESGR